MADMVNFAEGRRDGSQGCLEERLDQLEAAIKKPALRQKEQWQGKWDELLGV